jgi:hypothetical protein
MNATRLDPKSKLENEHVTPKECNSLFGGNKYKLKATSLALCHRTRMEDICWRVFGTSIVTNNEVPLWIVRSYIAQTKNIEINWAEAITSITREKTHRDDVKNGQTIYVKKENFDYATNIGGNMGPIEDFM